jgi:hypothetical protein
MGRIVIFDWIELDWIESNRIESNRIDHDHEHEHEKKLEQCRAPKSLAVLS